MTDRSLRRSRLKGSRIAPVSHESRASRTEPSPAAANRVRNERTSAASDTSSAARSLDHAWYQRYHQFFSARPPTPISPMFLFFGFFGFFFSILSLMTFGWTPIGGPMSEGSSRGSESFIPLASVARRRARVIVLQAKLLHRSLASQTTASRQGIH